MSPELNPSPLPATVAEDTLTAFDETAPAVRIGPYLVVRKIGEGGMGIVFQARQLEPIRRDVALKLVRPGMDSRHVVARFESERQALALMDHPNIARVLDAGATASGVPYFVMELVFGVPITRYCDSKRLSLRERVALFIPVCRAIQHAHQKGIIHRDIKPSNVIVAEVEGQPVPKVIDFGLAKALTGDLSDATIMTAPGALVGTVRYMSPEQAESGKHDIDTRSDIYSLGVLLYELAIGVTPHEGPGPNLGYVEAVQRIRDLDPTPPSVRARRLEKSVEIAGLRNSDPTRYCGALHGEFDWIVMKALDKERSRRYETANALARDLERFLAGEPLEAAPASASYRLGKFVRKHRAWFLTAGAFALLLMAAVVVSSWMAVRATRAEREAIRQRDVAESVSAFLQQDVLAQAAASAQAGPAARPDPDLKVRTALDRAARRIEGKFAGQPLVEASIRQTIATAYQELGLYPSAETHAVRALELRRRELGENNLDTARSYGVLGRVKFLEGKYGEAEALYAKCLDVRRRALGDEHPDTLQGIDSLAAAVAYQGKWAQAEDLFTKAVTLQRRLVGEEDEKTLGAMNNLAATEFRMGKYAEAGALHQRVLDIRRRTLGAEHPSTLVTLNNLGQVYLATGDYTKASQVLADSLALRERVLGVDHPNTLTTVRDLGMLAMANRDYAQADRLFSRALEGRRRVLGEQHPETLVTVRDLARAREAQGRLAEAEQLLSEALAVRAPQGPGLAALQCSFGELLLHERKYAEAERALRAVLQTYERVAPDAWARYNAERLLGQTLLAQNKFDAAEPLLLSSRDKLASLNPTVPAADRLTPQQLVAPLTELHAKWRRP